MYAKLKLSTGCLWHRNAYLFQAGRILTGLEEKASEMRPKQQIEFNKMKG